MLEKLKFLDIGIQGFAPDLGGLLVSHTGGGKPHEAASQGFTPLKEVPRFDENWSVPYQTRTAELGLPPMLEKLNFWGCLARWFRGGKPDEATSHGFTPLKGV